MARSVARVFCSFYYSFTAWTDEVSGIIAGRVNDFEDRLYLIFEAVCTKILCYLTFIAVRIRDISIGTSSNLFKIILIFNLFPIVLLIKIIFKIFNFAAEGRILRLEVKYLRLRLQCMINDGHRSFVEDVAILKNKTGSYDTNNLTKVGGYGGN